MLRFLVCIVLLLLYLQPSLAQNEESVLIDHLLKNYSKFTRPVMNKTAAVHVTFGFNLIQIIELRERDQYMTCKVWMRLIWVNELLHWDPLSWNNITHFRLPPDLLWVPDVYLQEEIGDAVSAGPEIYKTPIILNSDGTHEWFVPVRIQSNCPIDITLFPFDQQTCKLVFISWTHDGSELSLKPENKPLITDIYVNSSEWELLSISNEVVTHVYPCCPNPFVRLEYTLKLERKPLYYIYNLCIPCIVLMVIALFTFFLPADSGERIGVVITVLLVFAVYLKVLSDSLPKTSNSVPALSQFYVTSMIESACSLIATCFVLCVHHYGSKNGRMSPWLRVYVLDFVGKILGIVPNNGKHKHLYSTNMEEDAEEIETRKLLTELSSELPNKESMSNGPMGKLAGDVRMITSLVQWKNLHDDMEDEWKRLARIMDRVFFFIFLIIFLVSSLSTLMPVYLVHH